MKTTMLTAALLNFFIFPGSGHMLLNQKKNGTIIISTCLLALTGFLVSIIRRVWHLLQESSLGQGEAEVVNLVTVIRQQIAGGDVLLQVWLCLVLVCWLGSTLDIVRLAKKHSEKR